MLKFSYDIDSDVMTLNAHKIDVFFTFHNGAVDCIGFSREGYEISPLDDALHGLRVFIDGKHYTLYQLMLEAERQYDDVRNESLRELKYENDMERELSSPYQTGRI